MNPIKKIRKQKKLKQKEFAKILGCSQSTISKLENYSLEPNIKELAVLREVFKVNLNKLIDELYLMWG